MFNIIILNYFHCFFTSTIEIAPVQTILYQFKLFCPSSKTNCSKVKIELQHSHQHQSIPGRVMLWKQEHRWSSSVLSGLHAKPFLFFYFPTTEVATCSPRLPIFIYDSAPAHRNPAIPGPNSELRKLPPYSPFLNIVEQAVSALKAAIKADISRPEIQVQMNDRAEARLQGLALGNYRTQLLLQALQMNIRTITVAKCGRFFRYMQTYLPRCINNEAIEG